MPRTISFPRRSSRALGAAIIAYVWMASTRRRKGMTTDSNAPPSNVSWAARIVFTALAVLAVILGYVGLAEFLPGQPEYRDAGFLDIVYYDLQLFVLDSAPLQQATNLPVTLQVARFAAPAV